MHHLILDTCVWFDLAASEFSLVAKLTKLINDGKVAIVLPEIVRSEWDGCRQKIEAHITTHIVESRRNALHLMAYVNEGESGDMPDNISSVDPTALGAKIAARRIDAIENLLQSDKTIRVPRTSGGDELAITHALTRMAPFRQRNSMADALIFFTAIEWVNMNTPDRSVFVTHNTKDFSDEKQGDDDNTFKERLAPELQPHVCNNGMKYSVVIGRVLNEIERFIATEEEIEREEAVVERTRTKEDLLEDIISGAGIGQILGDQQQIKEMKSGGAIAKLLEEQRQTQEKMYGGIFGKLLADQRRFKEVMSGGAIGVLFEEQRRISEMLSGGVIGKLLEDQRKYKEMISGGAVAKMLEEQRRIQEMMSSGAIGNLIDEQRRLRAMISSGTQHE